MRVHVLLTLALAEAAQWPAQVRGASRALEIVISCHFCFFLRPSLLFLFELYTLTLDSLIFS